MSGLTRNNRRQDALWLKLYLAACYLSNLVFLGYCPRHQTPMHDAINFALSPVTLPVNLCVELLLSSFDFMARCV
jgi:hypothetical protein